MTAIAGLVFDAPVPAAPARERAAALLAAPPIRGRDDTGVWTLGALALAARQNRTRDLTPDGAQPFASRSGQMVVTFDGHVGNAGALRRELEDAKIALRGHSDAELVAEAACLWGLNRLLQKLEGAFAFALWDSKDQALHLVRDRLAAKPLYVTRHADRIAFSSSMLAFKKLDGFTPAINADACASYLAFGHTNAPACLWQDVIAIPPAHRMMIRVGDKTLAAPEAYWSPATTLEESALRGHSRAQSTPRRERLTSALAAESIRLDVNFAALDDFTPASAMLRATLDRVAEKPVKSWPIAASDGAALQTAFEALAKLDEPVSDPAAIAWWNACKGASPDAPVAIIATGITVPGDEDDRDKHMRKMLSRIPRFLHSLVPAKYAHLVRNPVDVYETRARLWDNDAPLPGIIEPRMDAGIDARIDFYQFCDQFCGGVMPALDRIAASFGMEARMPLADARMLDFGLPGTTGAAIPDIATWLRGPLRPRLQDLMTPFLCARIGITDPAPYQDAWKAFLGGDNAPARRLWALATLLAWAKNN